MEHIEDEQFPSGSMGPKVQALLEFHQATGNRGVICDLKEIEQAIAGSCGTEIVGP
jgi:carbamate kinase